MTKTKINKPMMIMLLVVALFFAGAAEAQTNNLITANSAGNIKLGMTVAEVRNAIRPMVLSFELGDYDQKSFRSMIFVKKSKDAELPLMMLGVDQETLISDPNAAAKISENAKITLIQIWDESFKTKEGIYSGMPLGEAQKRLGKLVGICWTTIDNGREYATFLNQPKGISFTIQGVEEGGGEFGVMDSRDIRQGDITTKYTEQAYIDRIIVNDHPFGYQR